MMLLWLAQLLDGLTTLSARTGSAAWGWYYAREKRLAVTRERRDARLMPRSRRRTGVPKPRPKAKREKAVNLDQKRYYDPGVKPRPVNFAKHATTRKST